MFCQKCGAQLSDHATVCTQCGAPTGSGAGGGAAAGAAAADKVKEASRSALGAFMSFVSNPVGGLAPSCATLQPDKTLGAGIVFGIAFAILFALGIKMGIDRNPFFGMLIGTDQLGRLLIAGVVPFVALAAAGFAVRSVMRGKGGLGEDVYLSGASLLPFGFAVFLSSILGGGNVKVIEMLWVFALCFTIMMLYAGMTRIYNMGERVASVAVPVVLILCTWLSKVILNMLAPSPTFGSFPGFMN